MEYIHKLSWDIIGDEAKISFAMKPKILNMFLLRSLNFSISNCMTQGKKKWFTYQLSNADMLPNPSRIREFSKMQASDCDMWLHGSLYIHLCLPLPIVATPFKPKPELDFLV